MAASQALLAKGIAAGNISVTSEDAPTLPSDNAATSRNRQSELLAQVEAMRRARTIVVPTNDAIVRQKLRELGHPITLFGERAPGRRERLRTVMARAAGGSKSILDAKLTSDGRPVYEAQSKKKDKKPVMYEADDFVKESRLDIFEFSIERARERVAVQKRKRENPLEGEEEAEVRKIQEVERRFKRYTSACSSVGDIRALSCLNFSPNSQMLVSGSWSGGCKIWSIPSSRQIFDLQSHDDARISDVAFHPFSGTNQSEKSVNLASCDVDGNVYLWPLPTADAYEEPAIGGEGEIVKVPVLKPIAKFSGHQDRCSRMAFHASGKYLATTSYDLLWYLWDLESGRAVVKQRGHSRPLYGLAMQNDGSLLATGDLGGNCRIWDLRSGKSIMPLRGGHSKQVLSMDFAPNGFHLATGSGDNTVRIWDIRKKACLYTIPAHAGLVSSVKWEPNDGYYLLTGGYDNTAKVWSATDFQLLRTFSGHEGKVTRCDVSPNTEFIATSSFDRTWKLWTYDASYDVDVL